MKCVPFALLFTLSSISDAAPMTEINIVDGSKIVCSNPESVAVILPVVEELNARAQTQLEDFYDKGWRKFSFNGRLTAAGEWTVFELEVAREAGWMSEREARTFEIVIPDLYGCVIARFQDRTYFSLNSIGK